ncbi:MAG: DUF4942 domain-containing protein [Janthinobacterium lividum]
MNEIVRKDSLAELVGHRAIALEKYAVALDALRDARKAAARACIGGHQPTDSALVERHFRYDYGKDFASEVRVMLDRAMWRSLVVNTPLFALMDAEERRKFEESLESNPPEVTVDALLMNVERLAGDADAIFRRGLVNVFRKLNRDYRSHDGFKIGDRVVLTYAVSGNKLQSGHWWFHTNSLCEDTMRDIDRVMHVLDSKPSPDYQQGLCAAFRASVQAGTPTVFETPYYRARWFQNGNMHLWFLRDDLVQKANRIIAAHYGMAVGAAPHVAGSEPTFDPDKAGLKEDFFPTPASVVEQMVKVARIKDGMRVLEPSAGDGAIVRGICDGGHHNLTLFVCENSPDRYGRLTKTLEDRAPKDTRWNKSDFLRSYETHQFDRILMNPPFSGGQGLAHLFHAWAKLAPDGRLVAILPPGGGQASQRATTRFNDLLRNHGEVVDLPDGAFRESGTMVRTCMVILNRPITPAIPSLV